MVTWQRSAWFCRGGGGNFCAGCSSREPRFRFRGPYMTFNILSSWVHSILGMKRVFEVCVTTIVAGAFTTNRCCSLKLFRFRYSVDFVHVCCVTQTLADSAATTAELEKTNAMVDRFRRPRLVRTFIIYFVYSSFLHSNNNFRIAPLFLCSTSRTRQESPSACRASLVRKHRNRHSTGMLAIIITSDAVINRS